MGDLIRKFRADYFLSVMVGLGNVYHREVGVVFWKVRK